MKIMEKAKRFFTLNAANHEGFTLVELIVVIAILAILAGVAVPVYSGYINKAKKANDLNLLGAVNDAFSAAMMEENALGVYAITSSTEADININADGTIDMESVMPCDPELFAFYFAGNEGAKFEVITDVIFDPNEHVFVELDEEGVIEALKAVIGNSNFNGKLDVLTSDVGDLIGVLGDYLEDGGVNALVGTGFDTYLTDVLGLTEDEKTPDTMANAAVLYLAHSAANMTDEQFTSAKDKLANGMVEYVNSPGTFDLQAMVNDIAKDTGSGLASYAMLYATAEALAIQQGEDSEAYKALQNATITDPGSVLTAVGQVFANVDEDTAGAYFDIGANFDKDMDAYFQTMQAVNTKEDELKGQLADGGLLTENQTVLDLINKLK